MKKKPKLELTIKLYNADGTVIKSYDESIDNPYFRLYNVLVDIIRILIINSEKWGGYKL